MRAATPLIAALLLLAACTVQTAPTATATAPATGPAPDPTSAAATSLSTRTAPLINDLRAQNRRAALAPSPRLIAAAQAHAADLSASGAFSHTGTDGSTLGARARRAGYGYCFVAENIARGQGAATKVMLDWMNSTGHRRNLLSGDATEFGMARAPGDVWVLVLGRPGC